MENINIVKLKKQRIAPQFLYRYIFMCLIITLGIFGGYIYALDLGKGALIIGTTLPIAIAAFMSGAFLHDSGDNTITVDQKVIIDKAITEQTIYKPIIFNKRFLASVYYYPEIGTTITPIFSFSAFINCVSATAIIPFVVVFLFITTQFKMAFVLSMIAIFLMWSSFAIINAMTLFKVWRNARLPLIQKKFVNMDFSHNELVTICSYQYMRYYTDSTKRVDLLKLIATEGVKAAHFANLLIESGATDAKTIKSEIAIIEHVVNTFVATTVRASNRFFSKHSEKSKAAEKIYLRDIAPQIREEALSLKDKIGQVLSTLQNIEQTYKTLCLKQDEEWISARLKEDEKLIDVDNELLALTRGTLLVAPQFPEFHQLIFDSIENQVAAENIVNGSLMTLVKAKKLAVSESDCAKVEAQINKTKTFVKSLAANTPESEFRKSRLLEAKKQETLLLGGNDTFSSIDNIIAIEDRYLSSYDNTLPAGK